MKKFIIEQLNEEFNNCFVDYSDADYDTFDCVSYPVNFNYNNIIEFTNYIEIDSKIYLQQNMIDLKQNMINATIENIYSI